MEISGGGILQRTHIFHGCEYTKPRAKHIGKPLVCFLFLVRGKKITHQFTHHFSKNPQFFGSETFLRRKVIFFVEISKG
jgi:hypothetical protein